MPAGENQKFSCYGIADFENKLFKPTGRHEQQLHKIFDEVTAWAGTLQRVREGSFAQNYAA